MKIRLDISTFETHYDAANALIEFAGNNRILIFDAPMGAGKTTFIKAICNYLGVINSMSSPTYSIVNEYDTKFDFKIFHFDLYRLNTEAELFDIGFEDYVLSTNYLFIEWPQLAISFLDSYVKITILLEDNNRYLYAEIISSS